MGFLQRTSFKSILFLFYILTKSSKQANVIHFLFVLCRQERESCLNNINLNHSLASGLSKEKSRQPHHQQQRRQSDRTYSKKSKDKYLQGSLENVSSNPFGEFDTQQSTLRRSRSLAISREEIFTSLDIPTATRQRRPQLIPRAKLIDRSSLKDRCALRDRNPETSQITERQLIKKKPSTSSEYATAPAPQINLQNPQKNYQSSVSSANRRAPEENNTPFSQLNTFSSQQISGEIDSLESNSYNKQSVHGLFRVAHDNYQHSSDYGLSLPNYYPDSRCDTDISLTDASLTDNISIKDESQLHEERRKDRRTPPRDNLSTNNLFYQENSSPEESCDNILYRDNISFGRNILEEKYGRNSKPRTIRQYTPFHYQDSSFYEGKPRSLPNYSLSSPICENDSNYEPNIYDIVEKPEEKLKIYEELAEISGGESKLDSDFSQSDLNFDEINLNNDNIKIVESPNSSSDSCFENNPIYDEIPCLSIIQIESPLLEEKSNNSSPILGDSLETEIQINPKECSGEKHQHLDESEESIISSNNKNFKNKEILKTCVQVHADEGIYSVVRRSEEDRLDEFRTIVNVEEVQKEEIPKDNTRRHSHNYLKEFLESQKGSKKPLQNFLSKKISRAFGDNKNKNLENNLSDNQFHSLPDLSIGRNLRQCEKIDRKLRKCEKTVSTTSNNNNRFIVNIGRHFDVTAESNIPVDFEVKISKIPKLRKSKSSNNKVPNKSAENKQQVFIDAVKTLNDTLSGVSNLDENQNLTKPQIIEVTTKTENKFKGSGIKRLVPPKYKKHKESQSKEKIEKAKLKALPKINEVSEDSLSSMDPQSNKEFQEKLDTMRNYWGKLTNSFNNSNNINSNDDSKEENESSKCKIVDVQTKVEDVIRKFEPREEKEIEKPESIVHAAKQLFEPKIQQDKSEKMSNFVKESCTFFENPFFDKNRLIHNFSNQFESLNPNIVEIIEKDEQNPLQKKAVTKTSSLNDQEFDHVRYRVMKSDLFQKNIFANCQKESQFDGLMQYLQDYSFQELLIDNNIVIIEPIRSNVQHETPNTGKTSKNITKLLHKSHNGSPPGQNNGVRRRFFYHPVRVNKEMNEDELPNPDTVKQVRQFFECGLKKSRSSQELDKLSRKTVQYQTLDPDKDNCSATDSSGSNSSEIGSNDNLYDNELCCELQYVSEDILQKIRECGTSVTYYGGKVLNKRTGEDKNTPANPMTRTIMEEIKGNQIRECGCKKSSDSRRNSIENNENCNNNNCHNNNNNIKETYNGIKFKLLKSNSCSSRLELVGTENLSEYRQKFLEKQKYLIDQKNRENQRKNSIINEKEENYTESTAIELTTNEEENHKQENGPKIVSATGKKMIQWGSSSEEKTYNNINFNKAGQLKTAKQNYDFHNYEKIKTGTKKIDDMEFETYEIA